MASVVPRSRPAPPLRVFVSYAHEDAKLKEMFDLNLKVLAHQGLILTWTDKNLGGGEVWNQVIEDEMKSADVILFMVSNAFLASDFIRDNELPLALRQVEEGKAIIVPIILKACGWQEETWAGLQALPSGVKAVTERQDKDLEKAFADVEQGLRDVIKREQRKRLEREQNAQKKLEEEERARKKREEVERLELERKTRIEQVQTPPQDPAPDDRSTELPPVTDSSRRPSRVRWVPWLAGAGLLALAALGASKLVGAQKASWTLPENETKLQWLDESGAPIDSAIVEGARLGAWVNEQTQLEEPAFRFYYGFRSFGEDIPGPMALRIYPLHARLSGERKLDGKELVFDQVISHKRVKLPQGEVLAIDYLNVPGWLSSGSKFERSVTRPANANSYVTIALGAKGALPEGVHDFGIVMDRGGELIGRSRVKVKVTNEWGLPEKHTKIRVLGMDDQPVEGRVIPAKRVSQFKSTDLTDKVAYDYTNGVSFPLKFQSKGEDIAGPLIAQLYVKATKAPEPPSGGATMSIAASLIPKPVAGGFTNATGWTLEDLMDAVAIPAGATREEPRVQFSVEPYGPEVKANIPAGLHDIGVEILDGNRLVIYRNIWRINLQDIEAEKPTAATLLMTDGKTSLKDQVVTAVRDHDARHGEGAVFGVMLRHDGSLRGTKCSYDLLYVAAPNTAEPTAEKAGKILLDPEAIYQGGKEWKQAIPTDESPWTHLSRWNFEIPAAQDSSTGYFQAVNTAIYTGKKGAIPPGRQKMRMVCTKESNGDGEIIAQEDFEIEIPVPWVMPENQTKVIVTDADGKSITDGHEIKAARALRVPGADGSMPPAGLGFTLKFQSKDSAPIKGAFITYYLKAVTAPGAPTIFRPMSVAPQFVPTPPPPEGYTAAITWTLSDIDVSPTAIDLKFNTGDNAQPGDVLADVHNVGIEIQNKDRVPIYRGFVNLKAE